MVSADGESPTATGVPTTLGLPVAASMASTVTSDAPAAATQAKRPSGRTAVATRLLPTAADVAICLRVPSVVSTA